MYPEFILIYVGLVILLLLGIAGLVLLLVILSKLKKLGTGRTSYPGWTGVPVKGQSSIAFCKKCASEFDAAEKFCPKCGTPR